MTEFEVEFQSEQVYNAGGRTLSPFPADWKKESKIREGERAFLGKPTRYLSTRFDPRGGGALAALASSCLPDIFARRPHRVPLFTRQFPLDQSRYVQTRYVIPRALF